MRLNSGLHLSFFRVTEARQALFDLVGSYLKKFESGFAHGEQNDPSRMAHDDRCRGVFGMREQLLDSDDLGLQSSDQFAKISIEFGEARGNRLGVGCLRAFHLPASEPKDAALHETFAGIIDIDTSVSRDPEAGVDSQNANTRFHALNVAEAEHMRTIGTNLYRMIIRSILSLSLFASPAFAQPVEPPPAPVVTESTQWKPAPELKPPALNREFRGVWVASVANIDWPSAKGLSQQQQLAEMTAILDAAAKCNLNAILLQVRPACDALYPSDLEPWSEFLTGQSGKPPEPPYDPLATWIRETHARGMELHAWFNPFRARHFKSDKPDAANHVSNAKPDWVRAYDNLLWLDPGVPEARKHSLDVILDVVRRYDIDGVHLDDYFYPYPKEGAPFPDDASYVSYQQGGGALAREDWRRSNIDEFVRSMYGEIKKRKSHVKVGISPFGIWRPGFPPGIEGFDAYAKLSADARRWLREGWLDYCAPQLYWPTDSVKQNYARLQDWWTANNDQRRHLWIGNYTSRIEPADAAPEKPSWSADEILRQIEVTRTANRGLGAPSGNIHFSMVALLQNRRGVADALRAGPYAQQAAVPACAWLAPEGSQPPTVPTFEINATTGDQIELRMTTTTDSTATRWAIQARYGETWRMAITDATATVSIRSKTSLGDINAISVQAIDPFGRESKAGVMVKVSTP